MEGRWKVDSLSSSAAHLVFSIFKKSEKPPEKQGDKCQEDYFNPLMYNEEVNMKWYVPN